MNSLKSRVAIAGGVACLVGIIWQWPSEAESRSLSDHGPVSRRQSGLFATDAFAITVSSSRPRETSKPKRFFPFKQTPIPGSAEETFLLLYPETATQIEERRKKATRQFTLLTNGIGRRHPDVLALREEIAEIEKLVLRDWDLYRHR